MKPCISIWVWLAVTSGFCLGTIAPGYATEISRPKVDGIQCHSISDCLIIFENPAVAPLDVFPAKFFLDDHADLTTVERIARMLHQTNPRLRERASWFLSTRKDRWPTEVDDWKADVRVEPSDAYQIAGIPGEASYQALLDLAKEEILDEEPVGYALKRVEKGSHLQQVATAIIKCAAPCPYKQREALLRGLYSDFYAAADVKSVRKKLLATAADASLPDESRRLAFIAYDATLGGIDDPDYSALRKIFASASPLLRQQLSRTYPRQLGGGSEMVPAIVASISSDPLKAIHTLEKMGPDAAGATPALQRLMTSEDPSIRSEASIALFEVNRPFWRQNVSLLARDEDPMIAMDALELAFHDSDVTFRTARDAARSHWFPGMSRIASDIAVRLNASARPLPEGAAMKTVQVNAGYMKPLWKQCPALPEIPRSIAGLPSLTEHDVDSRQAFAETDIPDAYLSAAYKTDRGWILGVQDGESSGKLVYAPVGKLSRRVFHSTLGPSAIFPWRGDIYAIAGGRYANDGVWPELVRLQWRGDNYQSTVVTDFPAAVIGIYGDSGKLVFLLERSGLVDLTDAKHPHWLGCQTETGAE